MDLTRLAGITLISLALGCGGGGGSDGGGDGGPGGADGGALPGELAFVLYAKVLEGGDTNDALWKVSNDGELTQLSDRQVVLQKWRVSPDRQSIAYLDEADFTMRMVTVADGVNTKLSTSAVDGTGFDWSPDGSYLLFETASGPATVTRAGVEALLPVADVGDSGARDLVMTSSGSHVVYYTRHGTERRYKAMTFDGMGEQTIAALSSSPSVYLAPANDYLAFELSSEIYTWSPTSAWVKVADGSRPLWAGGQAIVYESGADLRAVNADGTNDRLLAAGGQSPKPAPDGSRVAYSLNDEVHIVNIDGTGDVTVSAGRGAWWSPDSEHLAFWFDTTPGASGGEALYVSPADGSRAERASIDMDAAHDVSQPQWLTNDAVIYDVMENNRGRSVASDVSYVSRVLGTAAARSASAGWGATSESSSAFELPRWDCVLQNLGETHSEAVVRVFEKIGLDIDAHRAADRQIPKGGTVTINRLKFTELYEPTDSSAEYGVGCTSTMAEPFVLSVCCYELEMQSIQMGN